LVQRRLKLICSDSLDRDNQEMSITLCGDPVLMPLLGPFTLTSSGGRAETELYDQFDDVNSKYVISQFGISKPR